MKVTLRDKTGATLEETFATMEHAAVFCASHSAYEITLTAEGGEPAWDALSWQQAVANAKRLGRFSPPVDSVGHG